MITWRERIANLRKALGRDPTLTEMLLIAPLHTMTEQELKEQAESYARSLQPLKKRNERWTE